MSRWFRIWSIWLLPRLKMPARRKPATFFLLLSPKPWTSNEVREQLLKVLEQLHQADPNHPAIRIDLALLHEEFGRTEGAFDLLAPSADKLGSGEGARLYGHLLLEAGRAEEALPHLESYLANRTGEWNRESQQFQEEYQTARQRVFDELNLRGGPSGFKDRYDAANENAKQQMVEEYVTQQMAVDPRWLAAQKRYQKSGAIVPTIMDLGTARLRVAQAATDPAKRKDLLKGAEETFLSLRNVAGESDEFRLFLGQIYFWSSREAEGRKLFDELLEAKRRNLPTLVNRANIFREVGENNDATKLLDEAFPKATTPDEKATVVSIRSMLARSTDERIEWLSKAGDSSPGIAIKLAEARAEKAEETGDLKRARIYYHQALEGYRKQELNSASLNNSALIYRSLYRLDGRQEDFEKVAELLANAVDLQPANSILTSNASSAQMDVAVIRLVGNQVAPKLLQYDLGINSLRYLYQGEAQRSARVAAMQADPNFRKATTLLWDALLLSPKNIDLYSLGAGLFYWTGDEASLERLLAKANEQEFDFTGQQADVSRYLKGERDAQLEINLRAQKERVKALRDSLEEPRSKALAMGLIAGVSVGNYAIGKPTGVEDWLPQLEAAAKEATCSRLDSSLESALEIAALEKLAAEDAECAAIIAADRRLIGASELLQLLVRAKGELGERVRRAPSVVAAREARFRNVERYPDSLSMDDWLSVEGLHLEADARLKKRLTASRIPKLVDQLRWKIQFRSAAAILAEYWDKSQAGDLAAARNLLPQLEAAGLKLPTLD